MGIMALLPCVVSSREHWGLLRERPRGGRADRGLGLAMQGVQAFRRGFLLTSPISLQTDKEQLTAEAKELRQKVKYLQDQLSPLTRQREYQEKEIQRLNKVGALRLLRWPV